MYALEFRHTEADCACVRTSGVCACVCVCVCMRACVCVCACVLVLTDEGEEELFELLLLRADKEARQLLLERLQFGRLVLIAVHQVAVQRLLHGLHALSGGTGMSYTPPPPPHTEQRDMGRSGKAPQGTGHPLPALLQRIHTLQGSTRIS